MKGVEATRAFSRDGALSYLSFALGLIGDHVLQ